MSIGDDGDIRKKILKSVRKSASTDCESESLPRVECYPEYRIKFLERRKQFEQPPPPVNKEPFLPHWINPEHETDLSITYKKKGTEITDLKIHLVYNENVNSKKTDVQERSEKLCTRGSQVSGTPSDSIDNSKHERGVRLNSQNVIKTSRVAVSPEINAAYNSLDGIPLRKINDKSKQTTEIRGRTSRTIRRSQLFRIDEESSACLSIEIAATSNSDRTVDRTSNNANSCHIHSIPCERVVRPIVSKPIQLKKYDHIVSTVINAKNKMQLSI